MQSFESVSKYSETIFEKTIFFPFGFLGICPTVIWLILGVNFKLETSSFCDMKIQKNCSTLHPYLGSKFLIYNCCSQLKFKFLCRTFVHSFYLQLLFVTVSQIWIKGMATNLFEIFVITLAHNLFSHFGFRTFVSIFSSYLPPQLKI